MSGDRKRYPLGDASSIVHHLAVHDLMQVLLTAAQRDAGVVAWLPQRVSAALFDGYLRPDAIAAIRVRDRTILAFIEQDSGSERPPVLLAKLRRYRAVLGSRVEVEPAHILFVVPSARRLRSLREAFATAGDGGRPPRHGWHWPPTFAAIHGQRRCGHPAAMSNGWWDCPATRVPSSSSRVVDIACCSRNRPRLSTNEGWCACQCLTISGAGAECRRFGILHTMLHTFLLTEQPTLRSLSPGGRQQR